MSRALRAAAAAALGLLLAGCEGAAYLGQAALGQARLVVARRPVEQVLADHATPPALRAQLESARAIRHFAARELGMESTSGFESFAATGREFAVWNVVAAPEFSVEPLGWCFPIAGCVSYRGYFERAAAEQFAARLAERGFETRVYGVAAYSTLGWFDDPILDTWVMRKDRALAALMIHELAHQLVYAPGDTAYSEAFARVAEREGVRRWLVSAGRCEEYAEYLRELAVDQAFAGLVEGARQQLAALYAEPLTAAGMRARKREVFDRLRADYARASAGWPPHYRYDRWISAPLDNARLATVANYEQRVPALETMLAVQGGDLRAFYATAAELASLTGPAREARLDELEAATMARAPVAAAQGGSSPCAT